MADRKRPLFSAYQRPVGAHSYFFFMDDYFAFMFPSPPATPGSGPGVAGRYEAALFHHLSPGRTCFHPGRGKDASRLSGMSRG